MTNFGAARIRQDSLTHLRLAQSLQDESVTLPSAPTNSPAIPRRLTGKRRISKEQGQRILREAARKHSEPFPEDIAKALEKLRFDANTLHDARESIQIDSTSSVTPIEEEEANTNTSEIELTTSERPIRKNKGLSSARSSTNKLIRNTPSPSLSRPLPDPTPMRPTSLLVASLGNPPPYHSTRHSAAHIVLKHLQATLNLPPFTLKSRPYGGGHVSIGADVGRPELTLWQSPSLMNVSGPPLLKAWKNFVTVQSVSPSDPITGLIVLHDEMETESGKVKAKRGATSPRGHNGIKSVQSSLQSAGLTQILGDRYVKIGIGIGRPSGGTRETRDVSAYVLGQLTAREKEGLESATGDLVNILYQEMARIGQSAG